LEIAWYLLSTCIDGIRMLIGDDKASQRRRSLARLKTHLDLQEQKKMGSTMG
jgi:hypothetical protein